MARSLGDPIKSLPLDTQSAEDAKDIEVASKIFGSFQEAVSDTRVVSHFKPVVLAGVIFFFFSLPYLDSLIDRFISRGSSFYTRLAVKTLIFCLIFYISLYYYLAFK